MTQLIDENPADVTMQEQPASVEVPQEIHTPEKSFDQMTDEEKNAALFDWENKRIAEEMARFTGDAEHINNLNPSGDAVASHVKYVYDFEKEMDRAKDDNVAFMEAIMKGEPIPVTTEVSPIENTINTSVEAVDQNGKALEAELVDAKPEEPLAAVLDVPDTSPTLEKVRDAVAEYTETKAQESIDKQTLKPNLAEPIKYPEVPQSAPVTKKEFIPGIRDIRKKVTAFVAEKLNNKLDPKRVEKINIKLEALKEKAHKNASELGLYHKQNVEIDTKIKSLEEKAKKQKSNSTEAKKIKSEIDNLQFQKTNIGQQIANETFKGSKINSQLEKIKEKHTNVTERFNERIKKQAELLHSTEMLKKGTQDRLEEYKSLLAKYSKELQELTNNPRVAQKNKERITQLKRFISNEEAFIASTPAKMVAYDEQLAQHKEFIKNLENQRDNITVEAEVIVPPPIPEQKVEQPEPEVVEKPKPAPEKVAKKKEIPKVEETEEEVSEPEELETTENKLESSEGYKNTLGEYVDKWNLFIEKNNKKGKRKDGHVLELSINAYLIKTFNENHELQLKTDSKINPDNFELYLRHIARNDKDKKPKDETEAKNLTKLINDFKTELKK